MEKEVFDLLDILPSKVVCGSCLTLYDLEVSFDEEFIFLSYVTHHHNNSKIKRGETIPRYISKSIESFEVLGLLQAEMGKTQNGCITFANSEPRIINKVIKWFEKELQIPKSDWSWYIKVNMNEPLDLVYKDSIENTCLEYWIKQSRLDIKNSYPKKVSYIKNTSHKLLKKSYYGTLIIDYKRNLFSQVLKSFLRSVLARILTENTLYERAFMKGVIAGECNVECSSLYKHYRVFITATKNDERQIFKNCLAKIGIESKMYGDDLLVISRKTNLIQLLHQRLMTLHPRKYNKFLNMMKRYPNIRNETLYFSGTRFVWNKTSLETEQRIVDLYQSGMSRTQDIADAVGVSPIKVNRVLRLHELGKRIIKTSEERRKEIAEFTRTHPHLNLIEIAKEFDVSASVVLRSYHNYYGKRGKGANCKVANLFFIILVLKLFLKV